VALSLSNVVTGKPGFSSIFMSDDSGHVCSMPNLRTDGKKESQKHPDAEERLGLPSGLG
jgi:hypothetical protein